MSNDLVLKLPPPSGRSANQRVPGASPWWYRLPRLAASVYQLAMGQGTWVPTGYLSTARAAHRATLLNNGTVLVTGGYNVNGYLSSAEIYDPMTARWNPAADMNDSRVRHTATLLPDGTVLVAGGWRDSQKVLSSAEIYNPSTGAWIPVGSMKESRGGHTATLLSNGTVLIAGGCDNSNYSLNSAEIFTPGTRAFSYTSAMGTPHHYHSATLLNTGDVLVVGGFHDVSSPLPSEYVELFNHSTSEWQFASRPSWDDTQYFSAFHSTALLTDGTVLLAGGMNANRSADGLTWADRLNSETVTAGELSQSWASTAGMSPGRYLHTMTLLSDGTALTAGGFAKVVSPGGLAQQAGSLSSCERYNPTLSTPGNFNPNGNWLGTTDLSDPRGDHSATLLPDETVLVAGGIDSNEAAALDSAERLYFNVPDLSGCFTGFLIGFGALMKIAGYPFKNS